MSYAIIRMDKYKSGDVKGIEVHDQRERGKSHSNPDIDFSKSKLNIDLHNTENINYMKRIRSRIGELNLKKAVRKDAIYMIQCLITSDKDFFDKLGSEKTMEYFKSAYEFMKHRYGHQNIVSAVVHFDEHTPHMHVNFIPINHDKTLSAKKIYNKPSLIRLHDDFHKFVKSRGYDLERGDSNGEKQKHLTTEEFKLKKQQEFLKEEQDELEQLQNQLKLKNKAIQTAYKAADEVLKQHGYFLAIEPKKSFTGQKVTVTAAEFEKLEAFAQLGTMFHDLKGDYDTLKKKYTKLKEKSETSIAEKMKKAKGMSDLTNKYNELVRNYKTVWQDKEEILNFLNNCNLSDAYHEHQKQKREEIKREKSYDWGMER